MANGQQEEQQLPQVGTQQQPSLYQFLGSMSPEEHMKFKGFMHRYKGQKQISRNVGVARGAELMTEVDKGSLTIEDAVERSKSELTPAMKLIDQQFFKPDITSSSLLTMKERAGKSWTRTERSLWMSHYNTIKARENKKEVEKGRMDKVVADNDRIARNTLSTYNELEGSIEYALKDLYQTDKYGNILPDQEGFAAIGYKKDDDGKFILDEGGKKISTLDLDDQNMLNDKWNYIVSEIDKDVNPATYGQANQAEMSRALSVIVNLIPKSFLEKKKGIMFGDEFVNLYQAQYDDPTMRKLYFGKLNSLLVRAKGQIADVNLGGSETDSEFPTISTQDSYDALPSGTIFIDPNGDKRTKP